LSQLAALAASVGTGVVYGTDVFCALVQRPALTRVDDATLTAVTGNVHRFADRRMPAPGIPSLATDEVRARAVAEARTGRTVSLARPILTTPVGAGPRVPSAAVLQALLFT